MPPNWISLELTPDEKSTLVQAMAWAVRQQAITWANVDLDLRHNMVSLGLNELTYRPLGDVAIILKV